MNNERAIELAKEAGLQPHDDGLCSDFHDELLAFYQAAYLDGMRAATKLCRIADREAILAKVEEPKNVR